MCFVISLIQWGYIYKSYYHLRYVTGVLSNACRFSGSLNKLNKILVKMSRKFIKPGTLIKPHPWFSADHDDGRIKDHFHGIWSSACIFYMF